MSRHSHHCLHGDAPACAMHLPVLSLSQILAWAPPWEQWNVNTIVTITLPTLYKNIWLATADQILSLGITCYSFPCVTFLHKAGMVGRTGAVGGGGPEMCVDFTMACFALQSWRTHSRPSAANKVRRLQITGISLGSKLTRRKRAGLDKGYDALTPLWQSFL